MSWIIKYIGLFAFLTKLLTYDVEKKEAIITPRDVLGQVTGC